MVLWFNKQVHDARDICWAFPSKSWTADYGDHQTTAGYKCVSHKQSITLEGIEDTTRQGDIGHLVPPKQEYNIVEWKVTKD